MIRDETWLESRFNSIWQLFFPEVEKKNISIKWKGRWKNKFGHISSTKNGSMIAVNKLFSFPEVPEDIIKLTIAHEIVHYMHGFHSHLPKQHKHPHKGNIVNKELIKRGFHYMIKNEKAWVKTIWPKLYPELHSRPIKRSFYTNSGNLLAYTTINNK